MRCHFLPVPLSIFVAAMTVCSAAWAGPWSFTDVTATAGLTYEHGLVGGPTTSPRMFAGGVAAGDVDRDGWDDLYVVRGTIGPNLLFRNLGDGTFEEIGAAAGLDLIGEKSSGPTFVDLDADGLLDLVIGGIETTKPRVFRNLGPQGSTPVRFEEVADAAGIDVVRDTVSVAAGDVDRDGDLDLFLTHWNESGGNTGHLWRNDSSPVGNFLFRDADADVGLEDVWATEDFTFTPIFADYDDDGWPDVLVAADFDTSRILHNLGPGPGGGPGDIAFEDVTTPVITDENGMGSAVADYDNDGDLDWFVSSIWDPDGIGFGWGITGNRLYRNDDGTFTDVTDVADVREGYWGWGSCFGDFDNDGDLDLFHVNGFLLAAATEFHEDPARFFDNQGDGTFVERSAELGLDDTGQGRGVVCFDYDADGDLDLFVANNFGPPALLRNDLGAGNHFLHVRLEGGGANREAIGSRLWVTTPDATQMRELQAGSHFASQSPAVAHFGLGENTVADELRVRWPDGMEEIYTDVAADQRLVLSQPVVAPFAIPDLGLVGRVLLMAALLGIALLRLRSPA